MKVRLREATTSSGRTFRWKDHFRIDPAHLRARYLVGQSHLTVEEVLELLAEGYSQEELAADCPGLKAEDVQACVAYACAQIRTHGRFAWLWGIGVIVYILVMDFL